MRNNLGEFLKKYREDHDLSLRECANKIGISHSYLNRLETGIDARSGKPVAPTVDILQQIANSLNMNLEDILIISGYTIGNTYVDDDGSISTDYFPPKDKNIANPYLAQNNAEKRLLMLCRKAGDVSDEEREAIVNNFEATIDIYLRAKGLK